MSLNWKELEKILSELPLLDSYIQKVTEHDIHSLTLSMFSKEEKAWLLYLELSTPHSRVCRTGVIKQKSKDAQRFTQYLRAHIVGRRIIDVFQLPFDRAFVLTLKNSENVIKLVVRLFSGPGANIIITDENDKILELLFRRPKRGEKEGEILHYDLRESEGNRVFEIREYPEDISFNEFIDRTESQDSKDEKREELFRKLSDKRDKDLAFLRETIRRAEEKHEKTEGYEELKRSADILAGSIYKVKKGMEYVSLDDWERGGTISLPLEPQLTPNENLERYYTRYRKDKRAYELSLEEIEKAREAYSEKKAYWENLLSDETPLSKLKKEADGDSDDSSPIKPGRPGLYVKSNGWDLIVGRNAKENDEILRSYTRGSDIWMHTRDFAGGYVIIKAVRDKTVPLPVLLDAASLAIHFSKAKKSGKADLYYTHVKYLRRVKGGKTGLVLPTQEKNLQAELDEERVKRLLGER